MKHIMKVTRLNNSNSFRGLAPVTVLGVYQTITVFLRAKSYSVLSTSPWKISAILTQNSVCMNNFARISKNFKLRFVPNDYCILDCYTFRPTTLWNCCGSESWLDLDSGTLVEIFMLEGCLWCMQHFLVFSGHHFLRKYAKCMTLSCLFICL